MKAMVDACLIDSVKGERLFERCFSVLSEESAHHNYQVAGDGLVFSTLSEPESEPEEASTSDCSDTDSDLNDLRSRTWYKVQAHIPLPRPLSDAEDDYTQLLRPSGDSPLFSVQHELRVGLQFSYDAEPTGTSSTVQAAHRQLDFKVPLRFAHIPPASRVSSAASSVTDLSLPLLPPGQSNIIVNSSAGLGMMADTRPYIVSLPAYSQLFYPNGDRKIDYSIPLPLYTAQPSTSDVQLPSLIEQAEASHPNRPRPNGNALPKLMPSSSNTSQDL